VDLDASFNLPSGSILIVTGGQNAGKTSYCRDLAERWRRAGLSTAGILSVGRFTEGEKTGFFAQDLAGGRTRLLASRLPGELRGFRLDQWVFDRRVMAWGNRVLAEIESTDLLVIDELGPLEFLFQNGWMNAFELLMKKSFRLAVVVIRPECLDDFAALGFNGEVYEIKDRLS
jgi:nucleoside-triphosphatase THEP1